MADRMFGLDRVGREDVLESILRKDDILPSDAAQILLSMGYDMAYDIYDHANPDNTNPLATVMMHEVERYEQVSSLYKAIERYEHQEIHDKFGLSLTQYLDLPRDVLDMITKVVIASGQREQALANKRGNNDERHGNEWSHLRL